MPKGGDLHPPLFRSDFTRSHYYNVRLLVIYLNTNEGGCFKKETSNRKLELFSTLKTMEHLDAYKQKIMQRWSVYNHVDYPSDKICFF
jgi:hypothetical protein